MNEWMMNKSMRWWWMNEWWWWMNEWINEWWMNEWINNDE